MKLKNSLISCAYIETFLRLVIPSNSTPFGVVRDFKFYRSYTSGLPPELITYRYLIPSGLKNISYKV